MASVLQQLKEMTTVVADTGDFESIKRFCPTDATTNPTLLLSAVQLPQYLFLVDNAIDYVRHTGSPAALELALEKLLVNFGAEILKIVPGRVSTEINARLSYDTRATVQAALRIVQMYEEIGIGKERILIKIASTWEGIQAARTLESQHGIHCNLTLNFSLTQAVACAEAGVTMISPFVGRILDWHRKTLGREYVDASQDPGVLSVKSIYNYFKKHNVGTTIMGASFRNVGEIEELAGIDFLTISPKLLDDLSKAIRPITRKLSPEAAKALDIPKLSFSDSSQFQASLADNRMATDLLKEGIDKFAEDSEKMECILRAKLFP